jgi:hypothetical protein
MANTKREREFIEIVNSFGSPDLVVENCGGRHAHHVIHKPTNIHIPIPMSSSCHRAKANFRSDMRKLLNGTLLKTIRGNRHTRNH